MAICQWHFAKEYLVVSYKDNIFIKNASTLFFLMIRLSKIIKVIFELKF
jgi:hypothetical protein